MAKSASLEHYFAPFRKHIIGNEQTFDSPFGQQQIVYADWTATGRAYQPIEDYPQKEILPFMASTHTSTTITGTMMSEAYEEAKRIIKKHVGAGSNDVLVFCGSGMTSAVNKLQRILGMRVPKRLMDYVEKGSFTLNEEATPVVFVTHMEHHSNHISWLETIATVEIIQPAKDGNMDLEHFRCLLEQYKHRKYKIAAVTACSNVTGIETPYHQIAKLIHQYGGWCFVDFATSAPYVLINMHPCETDAELDAIYLSPHKFLGGPGTPGVLVFNKKIYNNRIPDQPGGGTLLYSNPWKVHEYISSIEQREDGGTPPFMGGIEAALCIRLKEAMGAENMQKREEELLRIIFKRLADLKNVKVLAENSKQRLGVVSLIIKDAHYDLIVKILNDRWGIQTRGGCSCAGIYGHHLLQVNESRSYQILNELRSGNFRRKPGWVRLSVHPVMTNAEAYFIMDAIEATVCNFKEWEKDYEYDFATNEYMFKNFDVKKESRIEEWFAAPI